MSRDGQQVQPVFRDVHGEAIPALSSAIVVQRHHAEVGPAVCLDSQLPLQYVDGDRVPSQHRMEHKVQPQERHAALSYVLSAHGHGLRPLKVEGYGLVVQPLRHIGLPGANLGVEGLKQRASSLTSQVINRVQTRRVIEEDALTVHVQKPGNSDQKVRRGPCKVDYNSLAAGGKLSDHILGDASASPVEASQYQGVELRQKLNAVAVQRGIAAH